MAMLYSSCGCAGPRPRQTGLYSLSQLQRLACLFERPIHILLFGPAESHGQCRIRRLCRPDTLGLNLGIVAQQALSACSDLQDETSATSILTAYCASKGYTSILTPTVLTTGASTVTLTVNNPTAAATAPTVTVHSQTTIYIPRTSSAVKSFRPPYFQICFIAAACLLWCTGFSLK